MRTLVDANIVLRYMLHDDESQHLDFVDCLLVAYNNCLGDRVVSFDRKLNRRLR